MGAIVLACTLFCVLAAGTAAAAAADLQRAAGVPPLSFAPNEGQAPPSARFVARSRHGAVLIGPIAATVIVAPPGRTPRVLTVGMVGASAHASVVGAERRRGTINHLIGRDPARWRTGIPTFARVRVAGAYPGIDVVYYGTGGDLEYDFVVAPGARVEAITLDLASADGLTIDARGDLLVRLDGETLVMRRPVVYQQHASGRRLVEGRYILQPGRRVGFRVSAYDRKRPLVVDPVLAFSTYLGGAGSDASNEGMALDAAGHVYVAGETTSLNFPVAGAIEPSPQGSTDAFVAKLAADGSTLLYATYLGGSGADLGRGIAVDAAGRAHVTGRTASADFPTVNAMQPTLGGIGPNGVGDGFVVTLSADGSTLLYATYLGGTGDDVGRAIAVDAAGNAYVTGMTASTDFPTAGALQPSLAGVGADGDGDAFVVKLDTAGALVYGTYLGGTSSEIARAIAVDAAGCAYVTGRTFSPDFPTRNALQPVFGGVFDGFVAKLDAAGSSLVYSTFLGGQREDSGRGLAVDAAGHVYVTGFTSSTDFPTVQPLQATFGGGLGDAIVAKLTPDGSALLYSTYLGGSGWDEGFAITVDSAGQAIVTGLTESSNFPRLAPLQPGLAGARDAFVTRMTATGSALVWSTHLGGTGSEVGRGVAVTAAGDVYVTGETGSADFPTALALQPQYGGGPFDAFVVRIREVSNPPAGPDLVTTVVTRNLAVLAPGNRLTVTDTVKNVGTQPAGKSRSQYYLSSDAVRGGDVLLAGFRSVAALAVGAQSRGTVHLTVPAGTPPGDYVLLGCADDLTVVSETDERNNCTAAASGVRVSRPDLAQQSVGPEKPTPTIRPGERFRVKDTVRNPSAVTAGASKTRYSLSLDGTPDTADRLLTGTRSVPALGAGKLSTGAVTVTVPASMPAGTYRILACADALDAVLESDESNNCAASAVTIAVVR